MIDEFLFHYLILYKRNEIIIETSILMLERNNYVSFKELLYRSRPI